MEIAKVIMNEKIQKKVLVYGPDKLLFVSMLESYIKNDFFKTFFNSRDMSILSLKYSCKFFFIFSIYFNNFLKDFPFEKNLKKYR